MSISKADQLPHSPSSETPVSTDCPITDDISEIYTGTTPVDQHFLPEALDSPFNEANAPEPCYFTWPDNVLKQELLLARMSQLDLVWEYSDSKHERACAKLERDIIQVLEKVGRLDMIEDICLPIETFFGVGEVSSVDKCRLEQGNDYLSSVIISQARIAKCYSLVDRISKTLMDTLGYVKTNSINNPAISLRNPVE